MNGAGLTLNSTMSSTMAGRVDPICDRFEIAWRGGARPQIEDYLCEASGSVRSPLLRELIALDLVFRRRRGETPRAGDYQERFPELPPTWLGEELKEAEAAAPTQLGRYQLLRRLGAGGFGVVYKGYDEELQRAVAVKVPHRHRIRTPEDLDFYLQEGRYLARLEHPGIVPVYDVGRTPDNRCYLVSKFVDGIDLAKRLEHPKPPYLEAARIVALVAGALHHAHQRGLIHRDIKPANILLDTFGNPHLIDFGLAVRKDESLHQPTCGGTIKYMSPEQTLGDGRRVDCRSDIYSLGVVLYEMLADRPPVQGETVSDFLEEMDAGEPTPPRQFDATIPKELQRICLRALAKRPSNRYSTAVEMADDLFSWRAKVSRNAPCEPGACAW